jgi:predicted Zn-ribbon and HTH transcriptional regulator
MKKIMSCTDFLNEEYQVKPRSMVCDDCGAKFPEFKTGGFRFAKLRTKCPECKSENIKSEPKPNINIMPLRIR